MHNIPPAEPPDVPRGSRIYVQLPGDHVLTGVLQDSAPEAIIPEGRVFLQLPNDDCLTANLQTLHNNKNNNFRGYRCYIPIQNNMILAAFLYRNNPVSRMTGITRVYLLLPNHNRTIFTGFQHLADGHLPSWLH